MDIRLSCYPAQSRRGSDLIKQWDCRVYPEIGRWTPRNDIELGIDCDGYTFCPRMDIMDTMSLPPILSVEDLKTISHSFSSELQTAYEGKQNSLSFLIHKLPLQPSIEEDSQVQVMVFGGTIFKTALFQKKEGQFIQLGDESEKKTPLFVDKNTFVQFVLQELKENVQYLALNFSYPIKPYLNKGLLDGILLRGTKQHQFIGFIGESVGKIVQMAILEKRKFPISVAIANDAVCLVLSKANRHNWNTIIGGIVGTGANYALTLPNREVINLESGNFNTFPISESGMQVDSESTNAGKQLIEKEIAGAYLFKHYNYYVKKDSIDTPLLTSTTQLSEIAKNIIHVGSKIAQLILERSAALTAAQMAGIYQFKTDFLAVRTDTRSAPTTLLFVMEGNLFWYGWNYKVNVERYLHDLGLNEAISITKNEHHSIKGALTLLTGLS